MRKGKKKYSATRLEGKSSGRLWISLWQSLFSHCHLVMLCRGGEIFLPSFLLGEAPQGQAEKREGGQTERSSPHKTGSFAGSVGQFGLIQAAQQNPSRACRESSFQRISWFVGCLKQPGLYWVPWQSPTEPEGTISPTSWAVLSLNWFKLGPQQGPSRALVALLGAV